MPFFYRKKLGLSQEQLADLADLHRTYVGSVERGERNISALNIERITVVLGVEAAQLLAPKPKLEAEDWNFSGRSDTRRRTITASVNKNGLGKMKANWIYEDLSKR